MNRYRIIKYGIKGNYEPQILVKGWLWDSWMGFVDHKHTILSSEFGPIEFSILCDTEKEAQKIINAHKKQTAYKASNDSKTMIIKEE